MGLRSNKHQRAYYNPECFYSYILFYFLPRYRHMNPSGQILSMTHKTAKIILIFPSLVSSCSFSALMITRFWGSCMLTTTPGGEQTTFPGLPPTLTASLMPSHGLYAACCLYSDFSVISTLWFPCPPSLFVYPLPC